MSGLAVARYISQPYTHIMDHVFRAKLVDPLLIHSYLSAHAPTPVPTPPAHPGPHSRSRLERESSLSTRLWREDPRTLPAILGAAQGEHVCVQGEHVRVRVVY